MPLNRRMLRSSVVALTCAAVWTPAAATAAPTTAHPQAESLLLKAAYDYTVERIQSGLNALGYDAGPEDGLIGGRTRSAIAAYQRDQGLPVTGEPSQRLSGHIRSRIAAGAEEPRRFGQFNRGAETAPARTAQADGQGLDRDQTLTLQSRLRRLGYDVRLTGQIDSATTDAIRDYERSQNLLVTGRPSEQLLDHMERTVASRGLQEQGTASAQTVSRVQQALNERGYSAGPPDGVMGPGTRSAIRTYQADAGLPVTGSITVSLLERLNALPAPGLPQQAQADGRGDAAPQWRTVFSDSFDSATSPAGTRWQAVAGDVRVEGGALVTQQAPARAQAPEEVGRDMLKSVLGQALGVQVPGQTSRAVAARSADLGEPFRLQATLEGNRPDGAPAQVNLGLYRGNDAASGARLLYDADSPRPWRLITNDGQQIATVASATGGPNLADGQPHTIDWTREPDGRMTVRVDGEPVLRGSDGGDGGAYDGVSLVNNAGTWRLDDISVDSIID